MTTITAIEYALNTAVSITVQDALNSAVSVAQPRLARGSNMHPIAAYAAQYAADRAELATEMAANRYTAYLTR